MISEPVRMMVAKVLEPKYNGSLGKAGGWADTVRRTSHPFSYGWHFISARDNPPDDCGLYYHRDCQKGGCVVQQIANQTAILEQCLVEWRDGKADPDLKCSEALKFVTHFVGDIAQPLHTSERSFGGNSVKVVFNGTNTNLHSVSFSSLLVSAFERLFLSKPKFSFCPIFTSTIDSTNLCISSERELDIIIPWTLTPIKHF